MGLFKFVGLNRLFKKGYPLYCISKTYKSKKSGHLFVHLCASGSRSFFHKLSQEPHPGAVVSVRMEPKIQIESHIPYVSNKKGSAI